MAQLVDRSRGRTRILSYYEAAMGRRQLMDEATDNYLRLLHIHITDYGVLWSTAVKKIGSVFKYKLPHSTRRGEITNYTIKLGSAPTS